jgi:hypothetical protein
VLPINDQMRKSYAKVIGKRNWVAKQETSGTAIWEKEQILPAQCLMRASHD